MSDRAHRDLNATIRDLRRKRRSIVQRRRRNRRLLAGAGALTFAIATATSVASLSGTNLADAAAVRARGFLDMMSQRSPGARTEAQLTKTKTIRKLLSERLDEPDVARVPANLAEVIAPPVPDLVPVDLGPPPQLALLEMPTLPGFLLVPPTGGGPKVPPGGGGGCCGGPPNSPPLTPPNTPPPPPLPEPGTWMTMLMGFAAIGWAIRRNRAVAAFAVPRKA